MSTLSVYKGKDVHHLLMYYNVRERYIASFGSTTTQRVDAKGVMETSYYKGFVIILLRKKKKMINAKIKETTG